MILCKCLYLLHLKHVLSNGRNMYFVICCTARKLMYLNTLFTGNLISKLECETVQDSPLFSESLWNDIGLNILSKLCIIINILKYMNLLKCFLHSNKIFPDVQGVHN